MKITAWNLRYHELIGLRVSVLEYPDPSIRGLEGVVVDETLKTLVIEKKDGRRIRLFKQNAVFQFFTPSGERIVIRGNEIFGRPWERVKMVLG